MAEKRLMPKQIEAIQKIVYVSRPFATDDEITKLLGIGRTTWYRWRRDPLFVEALEKEHRKRWAQSANDAMRKMIELADAGDRLAAQYILDSAGYAAPQKVELTSADIRISIGDDDQP